MRCSFMVLGLILAATAACAQQAFSGDVPASKQEVVSLLAAMHMQERTEIVIETSRKQTKTMLDEILHKELPGLNNDERSQMQAMIEEMVDGVEKDYPVEAVIQDMVPVYQRHLSKSDCEGLTAFYSSPLGQKVLHELPAITSEAMQVWTSHLQPRVEAAISKLKERAERMAEEEQKKNKTTGTKATPK